MADGPMHLICKEKPKNDTHLENDKGFSFYLFTEGTYSLLSNLKKKCLTIMTALINTAPIQHKLEAQMIL